jgi:hypothetical protein
MMNYNFAKRYYIQCSCGEYYRLVDGPHDHVYAEFEEAAVKQERPIKGEAFRYDVTRDPYSIRLWGTLSRDYLYCLKDLSDCLMKEADNDWTLDAAGLIIPFPLLHAWEEFQNNIASYIKTIASRNLNDAKLAELISTVRDEFAELASGKQPPIIKYIKEGDCFSVKMEKDWKSNDEHGQGSK